VRRGGQGVAPAYNHGRRSQLLVLGKVLIVRGGALTAAAGAAPPAPGAPSSPVRTGQSPRRIVHEESAGRRRGLA
jgi:hypothetical protein